MANLKLAKLPDRKPVKITITVSADLNASLHAYAATYRETYGDSEEVSELIPYMIEQFFGDRSRFCEGAKEYFEPTSEWCARGTGEVVDFQAGQ